jgi:hypothetical protein
MTALATDNIPTNLPAESILQDMAFGAAGGKGFQVKGSGGRGGGGGNIKTGVKTGGTSGDACGVGGIKTGGTGSGAGVGGGSKTSSGSGGGYGGGSGEAAASAPRGRAPEKTATASHQSSLGPGDSTGVICYARFVALLGTKMESLTACAGRINKYLKDTFKHDAFISDNGTVRVSLTLTEKIVWMAMSNKKLNYNVHARHLCSMERLACPQQGNGRDLTAYGKEYKETHPTWENLFADKFAANYTPAPAKTKFTLGTFVIRGVTVTELSA